MNIYDSYLNIVGEDNNFSKSELMKIIFHLVKNHKDRIKSYSKEMCGHDEYILRIKDNSYIQCGEYLKENPIFDFEDKYKYDICIKDTNCTRLSYGTDEFKKVFKNF